MPRQVSLQMARNIGIMAYIDAGKTITIERILYYTGINHKIGEIRDGSATMDWMTQEQERGITITSAATTCFRKGHRVNIIGTPGHADFTVRAECFLRVLGGSVTVSYVEDGVEPQSEVIWRQVEEYKIPCMTYVNKMDIMGVDFYRVIQMMKDRLKCNMVPIQLPIDSEDAFRGIIDLVSIKAYVYYDDLGKDIHEEEAPEDIKELAEKYYTEMVEHVAKQDDVLFRKYLDGEALTEAEISDCIHKATITDHMVPIICSVSYGNKGVQELFDTIVAYMSAPTGIETTKGVNPDTEEPEVRHSSNEELPSTLVFKIATDLFVDKLYFFRVCSGMLTVGSTVYNSTKGGNERIGRILQMYANHRQDIETVYAGDTAAAVGLKNTITDDTLCDEKHPIILESMGFPEPVIRVTIKPKTKTGQERMGTALAKLVEEDPTFKAYTDEKTGQTIIAGMSELHLEIIVDRSLHEFKIETSVGKLQVPHREIIRRNAEADTKYARRSDGKGQYGHAKICIELDPGKGYEFVSAVVDGAIPKECILAVDQGIQGAIRTGTLTSYSVVDVKVTLYDGSYHEVGSSEMTFKIAGSVAFKKTTRGADPVLIEPIMKTVVTVPDEYMGDAIGDLNSRRGMILGMDAASDAQQINAEVPLSEMLSYAADMCSETQGRGQCVMEPTHYSEMPKSVSESIISDRSKKND